MPDQRHLQPQKSYSQQTSHHASATSGYAPPAVPLRAVAAEPDTDAATEYELPPLDTVVEQGDTPTEVPDSEPPPPPAAPGDEQGLDAAIPVEHRSAPSTAV